MLPSRPSPSWPALSRPSAHDRSRGFGTSDDRAKVVDFLTTDLSDYVTGTVIPIDGGLVRWA
jgi:NAD(P)-dependent dehydrogenase (short-subunit alcohol dehydrogenase family)